MDQNIQILEEDKNMIKTKINENEMKKIINSLLNLCKNHKNYDLANGEVIFPIHISSFNQIINLFRTCGLNYWIK